MPGHIPPVVQMSPPSSTLYSAPSILDLSISTTDQQLPDRHHGHHVGRNHPGRLYWSAHLPPQAEVLHGHRRGEVQVCEHAHTFMPTFAHATPIKHCLPCILALLLPFIPCAARPPHHTYPSHTQDCSCWNQVQVHLQVHRCPRGGDRRSMREEVSLRAQA